MNLTEYLAGMRAANSAAELEAALQAPFVHPFIGPTWSRIVNVMVHRGLEVCDQHPLGSLVPRFGKGRLLTIAGESYRVARGGNSTGVRYAWHYAEEWAKAVLCRRGVSRKTANAIWNCWRVYPHRCLQAIDADPPDTARQALARAEEREGRDG